MLGFFMKYTIASMQYYAVKYRELEPYPSKGTLEGYLSRFYPVYYYCTYVLLRLSFDPLFCNFSHLTIRAKVRIFFFLYQIFLSASPSICSFHPFRPRPDLRTFCFVVAPLSQSFLFKSRSFVSSLHLSLDPSCSSPDRVQVPIFRFVVAHLPRFF